MRSRATTPPPFVLRAGGISWFHSDELTPCDSCGKERRGFRRFDTGFAVMRRYCWECFENHRVLEVMAGR